MNRRIDRDGLSLRLQEARDALKRQQLLARAHLITDMLLTGGKFIVGGLLASSFLQESLPKQAVGALGLIVLSSSLLRHYYHPHSQCVAARERVASLRVLIRKAEDLIYEAQVDSSGIMPRQKICQLLSDGLARIEQSELQNHMSDDREHEALIMKQA